MSPFHKYMEYRSNGGFMSYDEWKYKTGTTRFVAIRRVALFIMVTALVILILSSCATTKMVTDREVVAKVVTVTRTGMGKYRMVMSDSSVVLYGSNFRPYPGQVFRVRYSSTDTACIKRAIIQRVWSR